MRTRYFALVLIVLALVGTCARAAGEDSFAPPPTPDGLVAPGAPATTVLSIGW